MSKLYKFYNSKDNYKKKKFNNYKNGLKNVGNTCYLNSILQCLRINLDFSDYFLKKQFLEELLKIPESFLTIGWYKLLNDLWNDSDNNIVNPHNFFTYYQKTCTKLNKHDFIGYNQNDSEEFLLFFLNCIHDSLSYKDLTINVIGDTINNAEDQLQKDFYEYLKKHLEIEGISIIKGLFTGFQVSTISNSYNEEKSYNFEPFLYINLEIPKNSKTLYDCFNHYTQTDQLTEYKKKKMPENTDFYKKIQFIYLPEYFIIVLKRFEKKITKKGMELHKKNKLITFPFTLDMNPYTYGYINHINNLYDLQAITYHTGNICGGHYYSVGKCKDKWILYNDDQTGIIDEESKIINDNAYILFYKKQK